MSLPENHLDTVYTPGSIDEDRPAAPMRRVLAAMTMPLFFVVAFTLAYVSAFHAPKPHDLALTVAGPAATTQRIAAAIDRQASGAFDITRTTSAADARSAVADRSAAGAIVIGSTGSGSSARPTVTTITASAGGRIAAAPVQQAGAQIAQQLGTTAAVEDAAPLAPADSSGAGLFYLVVISSIGGYLTMTVLYQALPRARTRTKLLAAGVAAVATPIVAIAAMSLSVGVYGMDFGHLAAVAGIDAIYVLAVALIAMFFSELLGQAAILGVLVVLLALNFPSTGGTIPESMLPPAWQGVHAVWIGSGALESFRSLAYFGGNGFGWPFVRLLMWLVGAGIAVAAALVVKGRRRARPAEEAAAPVGTSAHGAEAGAAPALAGA